jgi:hypothetical protein
MAYSLLDLPEEVRRIIYRWLFKAQKLCWWPRVYDAHRRYKRANDINIILANKLVHAESRPLLLEESTVGLSDQLWVAHAKGTMYFSASILPSLRHIELVPGELSRIGFLLPHMSSLRTLELNTQRGYPSHLCSGNYRTFYFRRKQTPEKELSIFALRTIQTTYNRLCGMDRKGKKSLTWDQDMLAILSYWITASGRLDLILCSKVRLLAPLDGTEEPGDEIPEYSPILRSWVRISSKPTRRLF